GEVHAYVHRAAGVLAGGGGILAAVDELVGQPGGGLIHELALELLGPGDGVVHRALELFYVARQPIAHRVVDRHDVPTENRVRRGHDLVELVAAPIGRG